MGPTIIESDIHIELTDLLMAIMPELGFETVWLAPGVGPVKIETPNGITELIDYEKKGGGNYISHRTVSGGKNVNTSFLHIDA